jgi:cell division protein FtsB
VTVKESHEKCNKEIEELESGNERLTKENKKLRMEVEGYKKQAIELENNR